MIFNMVGGGGGSGATLVVSSPANVSVTVSKDDKSYTKNSGSLGSATFKGLATGTWTVTISGNGQTATKTIVITADYAITIAFFSASINITYPATSTCVVTNSGGQTVASDTNIGSSTKTWTATVGATGTYTVTATATDGSGKSKSATVNITTDGQSESVTLSYQIFAFSAGDQHTEITGGWQFGAEPGGYTNGIGETLSLDYCPVTGKGAYIATKNKIDLTNYSKIRFNGYAIDSRYCAFGVSVNLVANMGYDKQYYTSYVEPSASQSNNYLDVSSLTGAYYISISAYRGTSAYGRVHAYEIELIE